MVSHTCFSDSNNWNKLYMVQNCGVTLTTFDTQSHNLRTFKHSPKAYLILSQNKS